MTSTQLKYGVGFFSDRLKLIEAYQQLCNSNFGVKNTTAVPATEGAIKGAIAGGSIGGILAAIAGLGIILIPGVGLPLAVESLITVLLGAGTTSAVGGLVGGMHGGFLPEEAARIYNHHPEDLVTKHFVQDKCLIIVKGSQHDLQRARFLLAHWGLQDWQVYEQLPTINNI
ncbi:hypothetical protein NIES4102_17190 [Chondrocystis sp. NIES-4102]|nr:hypothetical protein NIES4102_17190 [Chondrocystis sp. NIES-4102]